MGKPTESEIIAEVEKLQSLGKDDLRVRWSKIFGKTPPPALTRDLLGRVIAWRIQEKFYGGYDKATLRLLDGLARGEVAKPATEPRLRPGTVLMREHGGVRHTVTVTPDGFVWRDRTYPSLSAAVLAVDAQHVVRRWSGMEPHLDHAVPSLVRCHVSTLSSPRGGFQPVTGVTKLRAAGTSCTFQPVPKCGGVTG
jgi:Protein of unknown function (DUF2924)